MRSGAAQERLTTLIAMKRNRVDPVLMIGIIAAALVACDARVSPNASQMRADQAKPIVTAPLAPPLSEAELRRSILFRGAFGLRSDVSWIMAVAADAASERGATDFGVPLLPEEIKDLLRRTHATPEIVDVILDYSRTIPDDWIGLKTDPKPGGQACCRRVRDLTFAWSNRALSSSRSSP